MWVCLCLKKEPIQIWGWLQNWRNKAAVGAAFVSGYEERPLSKKKVFVSVCVRACVCVRPQLCPTLCDLMHYSPPASSVHGILQARILEWVAISFSGGSSRLRDGAQVSASPALAGGSCTIEPPGHPSEQSLDREHDHRRSPGQGSSFPPLVLPFFLEKLYIFDWWLLATANTY